MNSVTIDIAAERCTLLASEGVGVLVTSARCSSPHPSGKASGDANHKYISPVVSVAFRGSVTPLPVREETKASVSALLIVSPVRHNPGNGHVLDRARRLRPGRMADAQALSNGEASWRQAEHSLIVTAEGKRVS